MPNSLPRKRAIQARAAVTLGQTTLARMLRIPDGEVANTGRLLDNVVPTTPSCSGATASARAI